MRALSVVARGSTVPRRNARRTSDTFFSTSASITIINRATSAVCSATLVTPPSGCLRKTSPGSRGAWNMCQIVCQNEARAITESLLNP